MKFKKAFAVILAVAMVITLMPTMAFAATTNSVYEDDITVAAGEIMPVVKLTLEADGNQNIGTGSFELSLDNAEWVTTDPATNNILDIAGPAGKPASNTSIQILNAAGTIMANPEATYVDKNSAQISLANTSNTKAITICLALKAGDDLGDVKVSVANKENTGITGETFTVATVVEGETTASVLDSDNIVTVANDAEYTGNQIKISENYRSAVNEKSQEIKLILPKDYSWNADDTTVTTDFALDPSGNVAGRATVDSDKANILKVTIDLTSAKPDIDNALNSIYITPVFRVNRDAAEGDVTVDIENVAGDISEASDLVIAENVVETVEVTTFDELTTVQSGLEYENGSTTKRHYVYVQLKENVADALEDGRTILFDFPEEVQVVDSVGYYAGKNASKTSDYATDTITPKDTTTKDASEFEWTVTATANKDTITFRVPVSVEAGFTGDIDVTVSGAKAGVEEQTVTVGTAVNPLTVEAATNDVKTGIQNQTVNAITLKETAEGMLQEDRTVKLYIPECSGMTVNKADLKAEVTEGDIEISEPKVVDNGITFTIKDASRKEASTIVISGFTVSLDRVAAEGGYDLRVAGNAVVDNEYISATPEGCYNFQNYSVAAEKYLNVITPADSDIIANKVDATFVVGESQYTNNGVTVAMDVASFIQNNRTYVPVRFLANALGVTDENIAWNEGARTVTLTGANTVVKLTVGSNVITTSTGTVTADVPVIVKDNRTYLPARFVANAFGADVAWDAATRTVTITR